MSASVGIVIVSHSPDVAKGAADMVRQMVGEEVAVAWCGGDPDGGLGTDVAKIMAAIEEVYSDAGVAMLIEYGVVWRYGSAGMPYGTPEALRGVVNLGFMILPLYRLWVMAGSMIVCLIVWHIVERSSVGARLRAATEDPAMAQALGINVPALRTTAFAVGAGIAALAGVLAAPIYQVGPLMGQSLLITVFAVVVIGGMGSIRGAVIAGFSLGLIEGLMRLVYPEGTRMAVFLIMAVVLLTRPEKPIGRA